MIYNNYYYYKIKLIIVRFYKINQTQINKKTINKIENMTS